MNHDDVYYALQDKLHDKEARIRELEEALRRLIDAETKYRWTHDLKGDDHLDTGRAWDRMRKASVEANDLLANSPPDSEPAERGDDRTPNERALEEADDSANYAYPDDTAEKQDAMLERRDDLRDRVAKEIAVASGCLRHHVETWKTAGKHWLVLADAAIQAIAEQGGQQVPEGGDDE